MRRSQIMRNPASLTPPFESTGLSAALDLNSLLSS
jgi:hypothetical protein